LRFLSPPRLFTQFSIKIIVPSGPSPDERAEVQPHLRLMPSY